MMVFTLSDINQRRGGTTIFAVERLAIAAGAVTAVLGPSGAGKTTLMRLLALLDPPDSGRLLCLGEDPWAPDRVGGEARRVALRRRMALVGQRPHLLGGTVFANVAYGLRLRGLERADAAARTETTLATCGLAQFGQRTARTLSGGEQQRVALARALAVVPEVLLLDEPTANLDPASVAAIESVVAATAEAGTTVVIVTHNVHQARRLAGQCVYLEAGQVTETGPAAEFFAKPATAAARAFVSGALVY